MSNKLSLVEARLAPGFRFHPTDEELISDYLFNIYSSHHHHLLLQIDLNKCEPWDLPETACVGGKDKEWYFYSQRDRKYATGVRKNRATVSGYWKATGKDRSIYRKKAVVGMRKTLVFYLGRAPKGNKTDWVMHEFRLQHPPHQDQDQVDDWVLCRVFCKTREIVDDNNKGTHEEEEEELISCCSSHDLPPLMDNNQLSFDNNNKLQQQQVPCFSTPQFEDHSSSCDNVKSILSRFHNSPCNDQSFLWDAALPVTMWYP